MSTKDSFTGSDPREVPVSKIAAVLMFGCAMVLASDPAFARARIRSVAPPTKPATVQPSKPGTVQASKPARAQPQKPGESEPQKPFAAAPRPGSSTFVHIGIRPSAAAPAAAPAQRAMPDTGERFGPLQYDPSLGLTEAKRLMPSGGDAASNEQAKQATATNQPAGEPQAVQPASTNIRMASPSAPAPTGRPTPATIVCYVQLSGGCVPF
jgi:hypothetical protein